MDLFYDDKNHREETYRMYQEIFADPKAFADYYFDTIYPKNKVLFAAEGEKIKGMIHLNPYRVMVGKKVWNLSYIVAVAVWKEYRRQGIMASMLERVLNDIAKEGKPFTYLIPANKAYYEPFDFVYVMDWETEKCTGNEVHSKQGFIRPIQLEEYESVASYIEGFMNSFGVHTVVDKHYMEQMELECRASDGHVMIWEVDGEIKGVFAAAVEDDTVYIRQSFSHNIEELEHQIQREYNKQNIEITKATPKGEPKIMARIASLISWDGLVECQGDLDVEVLVNDSYVSENNGVFHLKSVGNTLHIENKVDTQCDNSISIGDFTQILFGYNKQMLNERYSWAKHIKGVGPVYITEEV